MEELAKPCNSSIAVTQCQCSLMQISGLQEFSNIELLTKVSTGLSQKRAMISQAQMIAPQKYIFTYYYNNVISPKDIDYQRINNFEHSMYCNLRLLSPSEIGFLEHSKPAAYKAGRVAYQLKENVQLPDPRFFSWSFNRHEFVAKWQDFQNPVDTEKVVKITCTCMKAKSTNFQCRKQHFRSISYCKS